MSTKHELKTWPVYFERLLSGEKTFEVRKDDRGFQAGDVLVLREFDPGQCQHVVTRCTADCTAYSGRETEFKVGFLYRHAPGWLDCGIYVVMSLLPHDPDPLPDWERDVIDEEAACSRAVDVAANLAVLFRERRALCEMTLRDVCADTGVALNTLSRFERGEDIKLSTALKLMSWLAGRPSGGDDRG